MDEKIGLTVHVKVKADPKSLGDFKRQVAKSLEDVEPKFTKPKYQTSAPQAKTPSREVDSTTREITKASRELTREVSLFRKATDSLSRAFGKFKGDRGGMASITPMPRGFRAGKGIGTKVGLEPMESDDLGYGGPQGQYYHGKILIGDWSKYSNYRKYPEDKGGLEQQVIDTLNHEIEHAAQFAGLTKSQRTRINRRARENKDFGTKLNPKIPLMEMDATLAEEYPEESPYLDRMNPDQIVKTYDNASPQHKSAMAKLQEALINKNLRGDKKGMASVIPGTGRTTKTNWRSAVDAAKAVKNGTGTWTTTDDQTKTLEKLAAQREETQKVLDTAQGKSQRAKARRDAQKAAYEADLASGGELSEEAKKYLERKERNRNRQKQKREATKGEKKVKAVVEKVAEVVPEVTPEPEEPAPVFRGGAEDSPVESVSSEEPEEPEQPRKARKPRGKPKEEWNVYDFAEDYSKRKKKFGRQQKALDEWSTDFWGSRGFPVNRGMQGMTGGGSVISNLLDATGFRKFLSIGASLPGGAGQILGGGDSMGGGGGGGGKGGKGGSGSAAKAGGVAGLVAAGILVGVDILKKLLDVFITFFKFILDSSPAFTATMNEVLRILQIALLPIGTVVAVLLRPFLIKYASKVADMLASVSDAMMGGDISGVVQPAMELFGEMIADLLETLLPVFLEIGIEVIQHMPWYDIIAAIGMALLQAVDDAASELTAFVLTIPLRIMDYLFGTDTADKGANFIKQVVDRILSHFEDDLKNFSFKSFLTELTTNIVTGVVLEIKNSISGFGDWFTNCVKQAIINQLLPGTSGGIGGSGVSSTTGSMSAVPHLADGGVITSPQLVLAGEAGPEAFIPLDQAGSAFGGSPQITVQVTIQGDVNGVDNLQELIEDGVQKGMEDYLHQIRGL